MSVYKPAKSRFWQYDFIIAGTRFHGSTGQVNRRDAERAEVRIRREIAEGRHGSLADVTLDQAGDRWWLDVGQHRGDAVDVERRLATVISLIGPNTLVRNIGNDTVAQAVRKRRQTPYTKSPEPGAKQYLPSPATVNRDVIETLRPVMKYAAKLWEPRGLRVQTIAWGDLKLSEPSGLVRTYTDAEQAAWLRECGPATGLALELLLTYGLRLGELFFELADYDPEGPRLHIRSRMMPSGERRKGRKRDTGAHVLPLRVAHSREIAARVGRASAAGLDHIWYTEAMQRDGKVVLEPLTYYALQGQLNAAAERAGVSKGRRIHGTRHHAATTVLRRSGNLKLTARALGHANTRSTERYAHVLEEDLKAALGIENDDQSRNSPEEKKAGGEKS